MTVFARAIVSPLLVLGFASSTAAVEPDPSAACFLTKDPCVIGALKTPTSPAFMIIGVSPTQVERPTSPQDVAATVFDLTSTAGGVPRNLALEIAPYWFKLHPHLTYDQYVRPSLLRQVAFHASVSVATAPVSVEDDATDLSIGLRSHVFIETSSAAQAEVKEAEAVLGKGQEARNQYRRCMDENPNDAPKCFTDLQKVFHDLGPSDDALEQSSLALSHAAETLQDALDAREGIVLSFAAATSGRTPNHRTVRWDQPRRAAAWLTGGLELPDKKLTLLAVVRYTHVNHAGALDLLDTGARAVWEAPRLALSAEYMGRWVLAKPSGNSFDSSHRATATVEIPVTRSIWVSVTAGQDAATETRPTSLITLLGLSFQASRERTVSLPEN